MRQAGSSEPLMEVGLTPGTGTMGMQQQGTLRTPMDLKRAQFRQPASPRPSRCQRVVGHGLASSKLRGDVDQAGDTKAFLCVRAGNLGRIGRIDIFVR